MKSAVCKFLQHVHIFNKYQVPAKNQVGGGEGTGP